MKGQTLLITLCALALAVPALGRDKKHANRAMIEKMEAFPCGAKEHGISGLGTVWASVGATHINSDEKLCPQYMLRTDDMEYSVRPLDHKHPRILPVGQEGEFRISKDVIEMSIPDGDHTKRRYQVVAMKPIDHSASGAGETNTKYEPRTDQNKNEQNKNYADKPFNAQTAAQQQPPVKTADPMIHPQ